MRRWRGRSSGLGREQGLDQFVHRHAMASFGYLINQVRSDVVENLFQDTLSYLFDFSASFGSSPDL
jgi:hypothetical protein